jgi:hypothetical protein
VEVVRRFYYGRIAPAWQRYADAVGGFIEEAAFRVVLAFKVLAGRVPIETEKRAWIRSVETPALVNVYSWVDDRLLYSVLIWPSLETNAHDADYVYRQRVEEVKEAIARGAADKAWATRFETDYALKWDHKRECWVDGDGHRYDGSRFGIVSRTGGR